jgi:hypothetical protein
LPGFERPEPSMRRATASFGGIIFGDQGRYTGYVRGRIGNDIPGARVEATIASQN